MKKSNLIIGIVLAIVVLIGGVFWYVNNQNQETIVDLGDGWKSYHHNRFVITVKIPQNAKIDYEEHNIAWSKFYVSKFSTGIISTIGRDIKVPQGKKLYEKRLNNLRNVVAQGVVEKEILIKRPIGKNKKIINIPVINKRTQQEILLNNVPAFIVYEKSFYTGNNSEVAKLYKKNLVKLISINIPRYKHTNFITINVKEIYKQYPYLKDVSFEKLGEEYTKIIKPYILNIDGL